MTTSGFVSLANKRVLLGVSGSIAAYKSAELVRRLRDQGADVRVVLTIGGAQFVTALTFQAVSGNPVHTQLLDTEAESAMGHIQLARWADVVVVAPASANCLARLAQGQAEDLLSALCLATQAPVAVAPAMNQQMWSKASTQENIRLLEQRDIQIWGPAEGNQACGEVGTGRMLEPQQLLVDIAGLFDTGILAGKQVVITAGPTREAIDPVRYLSNRSSGKMGYALAQAAVEAGASVTLITGPTSLPTPDRVKSIDVLSAEDMHNAVLSIMGDCDIFIAAAAVADYRPTNVATQKLKKSAGNLTLDLTRNPDIVHAVTGLDDKPFTLGFAAETEQLEARARQKLIDKNLDMIAANLVGEKQGFDQDDNALTVLCAATAEAKPVHLGLTSKSQLARQLIQLIAEQLAEQN